MPPSCAVGAPMLSRTRPDAEVSQCVKPKPVVLPHSSTMPPADADTFSACVIVVAPEPEAFMKLQFQNLATRSMPEAPTRRCEEAPPEAPRYASKSQS